MENFIGYIGTGASGEDGGIRVVRADADTGALRFVQHVREFDAPGYFAITKDQTLMVSSRTFENTVSPQKGMLASLRVNADGTLTPISAMPSVSKSGPCHMCFSADERFVYAAHYLEGRATVYSVEQNGSLWGPIQLLQHSGNGPHAQQKTPHIHYAAITPDGRYVCYVDLGLDVIRLYTPDENGMLTFAKDIPVVRGAGARHLVFSPDGRFCWVASEMGGLLTSFAYNDGEFTLLDTVDTVEAGFTGRRWASAVRLSPNGKLLFVGNRTDANSVAVFRVKENGTVTLAGTVPCAFPRDLNILPNGRFLYVCGQEEDVVETFAIDHEACTIRPTGGRFPVPKPTCIEFLKPLKD